jgi:hypothetical protein
MARDYEDIDAIDSLPDDDLRELIAQRLSDGSDYDAERVEIRVEDGHVFLEGRVGTEQELQIIEQVVTNVRGDGEEVTNDIVVDALVRGERAEAADDAAVEDMQADPVLGEGAHRTSDTAAHLLDDEAHDLHGTRDPTEAIERGFSYNPPDGPVQEGSWSEEQR